MINDHAIEMDPLCKQMTVETFEQVVNAPATPSEMTAVQLANAVLNHPMRWLILKNLVYNSITDGSLQKFEDTINEAVVNNYMVDEKETVCLDIKLKD